MRLAQRVLHAVRSAFAPAGRATGGELMALADLGLRGAKGGGKDAAVSAADISAPA
jgi:hypothetical protein